MIEITKIAVSGILCAVLAMQFKNRKPEYSFYIGCVCAILIFGYTLRFLTSMLDKYRIVQEICSQIPALIRPDFPHPTRFQVPDCSGNLVG